LSDEDGQTDVLDLAGRFASPMLGAMPRQVHRGARLRDPAWLIPRLAVIVLVLAAVALAGMIVLEIHIWNSVPGG